MEQQGGFRRADPAPDGGEGVGAPSRGQTPCFGVSLEKQPLCRHQGLTLYIKDHVLEHLAVDPSLRIDAPGLTWHPGLRPEHSLRTLPGWPDDLQAHVGGHLQGVVVAGSAHFSPIVSTQHKGSELRGVSLKVQLVLGWDEQENPLVRGGDD